MADEFVLKDGREIPDFEERDCCARCKWMLESKPDPDGDRGPPVCTRFAFNKPGNFCIVMPWCWCSQYEEG